MRSGIPLAGVAGLLALGITLPAAADNAPECDADNAGLELPGDFCAAVVARDIGPAGRLAITDDGDIYAAITDEDDAPGGVVAMRDTDEDGHMDEIIRFGEREVSAIALADDVLFVGEAERVLRVGLHEEHLGPNGDADVIAAGLEATRSGPELAPGPDDTLYVQTGDAVWRFDGEKPGQQPDDAERLAGGIGPTAGMHWNPVDDKPYALARWDGEVTSSELLRVTDGVNYGWPDCYHDIDAGKRRLAPEADGNGEDAGGCNARYPSPELTLPDAFQPRDLLIHSGTNFSNEERPTAFISLDQEGRSSIVAVPLDSDGRVNADHDWETFATVAEGYDARLSGLAEGPDGSLYVSDAQAGTIWRIRHRDAQPAPRDGWRLLPLPGLG